MSGEAYSPSGPLDPVAAQIAAFFAADEGWQTMATRPPRETRAAIRAATPVTGQPELGRVEDFQVSVKDGEIGVRLYHPCEAPHALIVWAHGGGFVLGSVDEIDNFCRALGHASQCAIVSIDYRLAPEHPFPVPVEDLREATLWVAARLAELAGSEVPLFLGGDSAGANLATVVTRKLHGAGACTIAGNILAYPCVDGPDAPSLGRFEAPFLGMNDVRFCLGLYLAGADAARDPDFAPIHAADLRLLPPTLVITAEHDIITEQAEAYGRKLAQQGVAVTLERHPGMIHGFLTMDAFFPGAAGQGFAQIARFVASVPHKEAGHAR